MKRAIKRPAAIMKQVAAGQVWYERDTGRPDTIKEIVPSPKWGHFIAMESGRGFPPRWFWGTFTQEAPDGNI